VTLAIAMFRLADCTNTGCTKLVQNTRPYFQACKSDAFIPGSEMD
jgi:hypothetical protein